MAEPLAARGAEADAARTDDQPMAQIDWEAIAREPEFQELVRRRRAFVIPATIFFLTWYMTFIVLCAVAPVFMGERVYQGLTVGYVLALTQFLMVFVLGIWYLHMAANVFDPLAERAISRYAEDHPDDVRTTKRPTAGGRRGKAPAPGPAETAR